MGHISGIYYFDERPVGASDWANLRHLAGLPAEGMDHIWTGPGLAMAENHGATAISREIPSMACHWDGRLDNLSEVLARIGPARLDSRQCEAELVLLLHENKSWKHLRNLVGDWSLAVWDGREHSISLASDYAGTRPLYYSLSQQSVLWSSSLEGLAAWSGRNEIDQNYMAEFLTCGAATGRTPYRNIAPVPPGWALRITTTGIHSECLWNPPIANLTVLRTEAEYEERLSELFREAVAVRLNTHGPVVAELSGGLDSSSVVCMAHRLISTGAVAATKLITLSYCDGESFDAAFIAKVEQDCGLSGYHVDLRHFGFATTESVGRGAPSWWGPRNIEVVQRAEELGATTLLTGQLGDLVMGNWFDGSEQVAHQLSEGHIRLALDRAVGWSRALRKPIYPILVGALRSLMSNDDSRMASFGTSSNSPDDTHTSLTGPTMRRADDICRLRLRTARWRHALPGRRARLRGLLETLESRHMQTPENLQPISCSHPFTHRPLAEFMLTIPPEIAYAPSEPRRLMRRAFAGLVPQTVLRRRSKAGYSKLFRRSLVPMANKLLSSPSPLVLAEGGFVEPCDVRRRLQEFVQGLACHDTQLRHILLMEFWLRQRVAATRSEEK